MPVFFREFFFLSFDERRKREEESLLLSLALSFLSPFSLCFSLSLPQLTDNVAQPLVVLPLPRVSAEAEIDHFDRRLAVLCGQEEVLRLEISVNDALRVEVTHCLENRLGAACGAIFTKLAVACDRLKELTSFAERDDEMDRL